MVAVKQLSVTSQQGKSQFVAEIASISAVQHRNLVKLFGFCIKGNKKLLVFEYLENNSLEHSLFGKKMFKVLPLCTSPMDLLKKKKCIFKKFQIKNFFFIFFIL